MKMKIICSSEKLSFVLFIVLRAYLEQTSINGYHTLMFSFLVSNSLLTKGIK